MAALGNRDDYPKDDVRHDLGFEAAYPCAFMHRYLFMIKLSRIA